MKKILFALTLVALTSLSAMSQFATPRVGTGVKYDPRNLNYSFSSYVDGTGSDSVTISPNAWLSTIKITLLDSFTLKNPVTTNCYYGDQIQIIFSAASGTPKLKFSGAAWKTAGSAVLSTGLVGIISLVFDGTKYVEKSRVVQ